MRLLILHGRSFRQDYEISVYRKIVVFYFVLNGQRRGLL